MATYYEYNASLSYDGERDYEPILPTAEIAPSQASGHPVSVETSSNVDLQPVVSISYSTEFLDSITNYTGTSVPYNDGTYNDGPYEPIIGVSPQIYIELAPSFSQRINFAVDAELIGYLTETTTIIARGNSFDIVTENYLDVETSSSTADGQSFELEMRAYPDINLGASTSTGNPFEVQTSSSIDISIAPSTASGNSVYAQQINFEEPILISTSQSNGLTVDWTLGQTVNLTQSTSETYVLEITIDEDFDILLLVTPSEARGHFPASVGGLQDRMRGKRAMGRRARPFAMV